MSGVLVASDERMGAHDPTPGHPESPRRLHAMQEAVATLPAGRVTPIACEPAAADTLSLVHERSYVDWMLALDDTRRQLDPDTAIGPGSVPAARLAAGAALAVTRRIVEGPARRGVAIVRPPGHHAEPDRAMGFCLLSNVAIAAAHAIAALGCRRVLVVDWDVHHGNGTQAAFYDRADVLYYSVHEW
ncbi:MAG: histone deacetylase, partial [Phycisphaerae bacterium]|nr:histone deacetylase [Phycisphaerae bacterium]